LFMGQNAVTGFMGKMGPSPTHPFFFCCKAWGLA
jgi:hypothetical protein